MVNPNGQDETLNFEIERKWLVSSLPVGIDLKNCKSESILQGYYTEDDGKVIRLRQKGKKYYRTHKVPTDNPVKRVEYENEISEEEFLVYWAKTEARRVEKTRNYIESEGHTIELDVFLGDNSGHIMVEVEFDTIESAELFTPPGWFGLEVTEDMRYTNSDIAKNGFPEAV